MKRTLLTAIAIIAGLAVLLPSCKKDNNNEEPTIVPVSNVSLDCTELSIEVGETRPLTATVKPDNADDKALRWLSLDPTIVSVDENGTVTGLANGTGKITARPAADQSFDKAAYCVVTVVDKVIPAEKITLNKASLNMFSKKSYQLTATIEPADATVTEVIWESSDEDIAVVDEKGIVTALQDGDAIITASVKNADGTISEDCGVTVYGVSLSKTSGTIGVKDTLALAPYIVSESIPYSDIAFVLASEYYAETVEARNDEFQNIVGLSAGTALVVAVYKGDVKMDTGLDLAFTVEVEDTFLTYISDVFNIKGLGAVAATEKILAGTVNVNDKVLIMQAVDTCKNYAVRVAGLQYFRADVPSASAGDTGVGFLFGTDIPYKSIKRGSAIMGMTTNRIAVTKKLTGIMYITTHTPLMKDAKVSFISNNAETLVQVVDMGDKEMLLPNKAHFNIGVEAVSTPNLYDSVICSLGQKIILRVGGTNVGTFIVTDFKEGTE